MTPEEIQEMLIRIDERTISIDRRTATLEKLFDTLGKGDGFGRCVRHQEKIIVLDERLEELENSNRNLFRLLAMAVISFVIWLVQSLITSFKV